MVIKSRSVAYVASKKPLILKDIVMPNMMENKLSGLKVWYYKAHLGAQIGKLLHLKTHSQMELTGLRKWVAMLKPEPTVR
jgi:hypothetical protein